MSKKMMLLLILTQLVLMIQTTKTFYEQTPFRLKLLHLITWELFCRGLTNKCPNLKVKIKAGQFQDQFEKMPCIAYYANNSCFFNGITKLDHG